MGLIDFDELNEKILCSLEREGEKVVIQYFEVSMMKGRGFLVGGTCLRWFSEFSIFLNFI